ncbi:ANTAR domain-containing protein [Kocuria sp. U4B]
MSRAPRTRPSVQAEQIDRVLTSLGQRLGAVTGGAAVAAIAQAAVHHVAGTRWASVSVATPGRFRTLVATAPMAAQADALQHATGQGPAVDPLLEGAVHLVGDLARDRRWPAFTAGAAQHLDVASLVVYRLPLPEDPGTTVGLSLYADVPDAFDGPGLWAGSVLASHAVMAVAAGHHRRQTQHQDQAVAGAREVGTATGVLMTRYGLSREEALEMIRATAQDTHRSMAQVAAEIIDTELHRLPPMPTGPQHLHRAS